MNEDDRQFYAVFAGCILVACVVGFLCFFGDALDMEAEAERQMLDNALPMKHRIEVMSRQ